jgi:AbrB family looped-hinge helix DNA binding protein
MLARIDARVRKTHLTEMSFTTLSDAGQVVVPKATRDRLGWHSGLDLEMIETLDAVTLRPRRVRQELTMDEAIRRLRSIYTHSGPPALLDDIAAAVQDTVDDRWHNRA